MKRKFLAASLVLMLAGCRSGPPLQAVPAGDLLGDQLKRQDEQLIGQRFRTLLDFEHDADAVFVRGGVSNVTSVTAHTGAQSLRIEGNTAVIGIDPLLYGKQLSRDWSLLGAYLRLGGSGRVSTSLIADDQVIASTQRDTTADIWLFAAVDLADAAVVKQLQSAKKVQLRVEVPIGGFLMDDVLLVNNRRSLVPTPMDEVPKWTVEKEGLTIAIDAEGRFTRSIASTLASPQGWSEDEVNPIRARFGGGATHKTWAIYSDGRSIQDGRMSLFGAAPAAMIAAHAKPAEVTVDDALGRLDRNAPGDLNNDGYNELRGAYEIVANAPRVVWKVAPQRDTPLISPVFELKNLPGDTFSVTIEGRLFHSACRIDASTVLVVLPITIDRPTEIVVKASNNQATANAAADK